MDFKLNYKQYSDFININYGVFSPLRNFVNKKQFNSILRKKILDKYFFPYPIFFGLDRNQYNKIKNEKTLILKYKSKRLANIKKLDFFDIDKSLFGKKIFGKKFKKHPYFKIFNNENYKFFSFKIYKKFNSNDLPKYFVSPSIFKKKIQRLKLLSGFHTRNVPHLAHEWIHQYLFKKYGGLLIQPLIGQYKKGEYKDQYIMRSNINATKFLKSTKVFCLPFFSYPRYGGPLEASLHAIVRKNYGCTHFWVGRDHAGYKSFFSKYKSQKFCKLNQKKLGIKIVSEKEPFYCKIHRVVTNKCKTNKCNKNKILINGTKIRSLIKRNKKISNILMRKEISKYLNKNSLI